MRWHVICDQMDIYAFQYIIQAFSFFILKVKCQLNAHPPTIYLSINRFAINYIPKMWLCTIVRESYGQVQNRGNWKTYGMKKYWLYDYHTNLTVK